MTVVEFAIYRYAGRLMRPDERARAKDLAQKADAGDSAALVAFQELASEVVQRANRAKTRRKT